MKIFRIAVILIGLTVFAVSALAAPNPAGKWDNLLDVSYRFSWYPKADVQSLLDGKSQEYGQDLEEYRDLLAEELTGGQGGGRLLDPDTFVQGKPWKKYYHLGLAEFCLFLSDDKAVHLENARTAMAALEGKKDQMEVAFWINLLRAYDDMLQRDSEAFVSSVFDLWQDVILKLEVDDILMESEMAKSGFVKSLPFLYENVAHLVIRRAIVEKEMGQLYALGAIVLNLEDKLSIENGYRNIVEPIVERMRGIQSDNINLNFAVAFLEATANRYDFEEEESPSLVLPKFNLAQKYYQLAYHWADTPKGKSAILTHYMGFLNYITRRISDPDDVLAKNPFFSGLPSTASNYLDSAVALYDELSRPEVVDGGYVKEGFAKRNDYIKAMHLLWDASAKLSIRLADYFKNTRELQSAQDIFPAEMPLLKYLSLFKRHAQQDVEVVPDNAYFLAAYASGLLADLYRQVSEFSTDSTLSERAFSYQLQAIEIFPADLSGVLQLAYQATRDGLNEDYFRYTSQISSRLRLSKESGYWLENNQTPFNAIVESVGLGIPEVLDRAYVLLNAQKRSEGTENGLFRKTLLMGQLVHLYRNSQMEEELGDVLTTVGKADFSADISPASQLLSRVLPAELYTVAQSLNIPDAQYDLTGLKNELYASLDSPLHSWVRSLYYEVSYDRHAYVKLLQDVSGR